jgi:hypothetical protein
MVTSIASMMNMLTIMIIDMRIGKEIILKVVMIYLP